MSETYSVNVNYSLTYCLNLKNHSTFTLHYKKKQLKICLKINGDTKKNKALLVTLNFTVANKARSYSFKKSISLFQTYKKTIHYIKLYLKLCIKT